MNITAKQQEAINRLAKGPDGDFLISFYKEVIKHYADVRQIKNVTPEDIKARQIVCDILDVELVQRLTRNQSETRQIIKEEYE